MDPATTKFEDLAKIPTFEEIPSPQTTENGLFERPKTNIVAALAGYQKLFLSIKEAKDISEGDYKVLDEVLRTLAKTRCP